MSIRGIILLVVAGPYVPPYISPQKSLAKSDESVSSPAHSCSCFAAQNLACYPEFGSSPVEYLKPPSPVPQGN